MKLVTQIIRSSSRSGLLTSRLVTNASQNWPTRGLPHHLFRPRCSHVYRQPLVQALYFSSSSRTWAKQSSDDSDTVSDEVLSAPDVSLAGKDGKICCTYFDGSGRIVSKERHLTKEEIAKQFDLRHRDLRDIDLKSEAVTRILVRPATVLLQFFDLCMIIQAHEALLIDLSKARKDRSNDFYQEFERRLSGFKETADVPELPYELRAVEAALIAVLSGIREDLIETKQEAEDRIQDLRLESGLVAVGLDRLFDHSRSLGKIEQKSRLVRDTIREVLDADEDLAGMYLTDLEAGRPHRISDHQEAEYMLEAYHKAADGLAQSAHAVVRNIRKKESLFRSSLAVQRNQIMFLEAKIAIHTLGLAAGTLIAGLFGMNLVNYFEESPYGFAVVTGVCIVMSASFSMYGMRSIRRIQMLKEVQDQTFRNSRR